MNANIILKAMIRDGEIERERVRGRMMMMMGINTVLVSS